MLMRLVARDVKDSKGGRSWVARKLARQSIWGMTARWQSNCVQEVEGVGADLAKVKVKGVEEETHG